MPVRTLIPMNSSRAPLNRRTALAVAGSAAVVVVVVLTALFANLGLLRATTVASDKVGKLDGANVAQLVSSDAGAVGGSTATTTSSTAPTTPRSGEADEGHGAEPTTGHDADD